MLPRKFETPAIVWSSDSEDNSKLEDLNRRRAEENARLEVRFAEEGSSSCRKKTASRGNQETGEEEEREIAQEAGKRIRE